MAKILRVCAGAILFLQIFLLLCFNLTLCASEPKGIVAELTDEYFEDGLLDYRHALVLFYSTDCSHCTNFMPIFKMAADELIRNEPPVHSAMVDCAQSGKIVCIEEEIKHLPTLKIFRRAVLYDEYDGARELKDLVSYMKKLVGITSMELSIDNLSSFAHSQKEVAIVAVLKTQGNLREKYFSLPAELSKDIRFGHVTIDSNKIHKSNLTYGVTLYYPEHMRTKFEPWEYAYNTTNEGYDLLDFISSRKHGIVGLRDVRHVDDFAPPLVIIYFRFDLKFKVKMFMYWRNRILKVAQNYKHVFKFAISPIDDFQNEFVKFGIDLPNKDRMDTPLVFAILGDNTKYLMEDEFSVDRFDSFLGGILNGSVELHLKSLPIPEKIHDKGYVQIAVAKNFKTEIWDNKKDVLIMFFAPWCTYCKEMDGALNNLAHILMNDDIEVYKMDVTVNEIPAKFDTPRFPTVYLLPKHTKMSPILYDGLANVDDLISFVSKYSTNELLYIDRSGRNKKIEL